MSDQRPQHILKTDSPIRGNRFPPSVRWTNRPDPLSPLIKNNIRMREEGDEPRIPTDSRSHDRIVRFAGLPLRLMVGYGFLMHGLAKWSRGPEAFAGVECNWSTCRGTAGAGHDRIRVSSVALRFSLERLSRWEYSGRYCAPCRHRHRPYSLRLQLNQALDHHRRNTPIWTAGL